MKTMISFKSFLSILLTACMLLTMLPVFSVSSGALYGLDGIEGSGTESDPAVVDSWIELKTALEASANSYIEVDVENFENTTTNGYSYLFKNLHYQNGSFITIPAGYAKDLTINTYGGTFKFVASPDSGNGALESFIRNKGELTVSGVGKLSVGFNGTAVQGSIFLNEGKLDLNCSLEFDTNCAEVDGVRAAVITNRGQLVIKGGTYIGSNNATSGSNKGLGAYAVYTGHGSGTSTNIYGGIFKAVNATEGATAMGIYNSAQYGSWNTVKFHGGFFYGINNFPAIDVSMNSLENCLAPYCVYREGENGETLFSGKGITSVESTKQIRVSNLKDWIDFNSTVPEISSGTVAPEESFKVGTIKEYSFSYNGLPTWLSSAGYSLKSGIYAFNTDKGETAISKNGKSLFLNELTESGSYRICMYNTLYDADGDFSCEYMVVYPVTLHDEIVTEITATVTAPVVGEDPDYYVDVQTEGVYVSNVIWEEIYGEGQWDFREMEDGDVFEADNEYSVHIVFSPLDGVTIEDGARAVINGNNCGRVVQTETEISFNRSFGKAAYYVDITDLPIPNAGDDPNAPLMYELESNLDCYIKTHEWLNTDGTAVDTFEAGKTYNLGLGIYPEEGSSFEGISAVVATVNGEAADAIVASSGKKMAVAISITIPKNYITIDNFTYPVGGASSTTVPEYTIDTSFPAGVYSVEYLDTFGDVFNGNFIGGYTYQVRFVVKGEFPPTGEINVKINGETADSYEVRISRDVAVIEHAFVVNDVAVMFTGDSETFVGGTATIDLEKMAEYDEDYKEAYLKGEMIIIWYKNDQIVSSTDDLSGISYTFTEADEGAVFHVEVYPYGAEKTAVSDKFTVTLEEYIDPDDVMKGDANGDGKVNIGDVSLILKKIAGWDVTINEKASDVTGDGKVNIGDVSLILKKIAGWDVVLK